MKLNPLSTYGQLLCRLAILPSSVSRRERTSGSRDDGTSWISRAARRSSPYPTLLRRCSESSIQLRTNTIPLADPSDKSSRKYSAFDSRPCARSSCLPSGMPCGSVMMFVP
ncbi:hypothetical protein DPMN_106798 [Dreissena polymorpha]|uniref:Uncharacterized protein n=1 Tax=Dreissena polymorpha TaxID=45954 RepID=A0A9D4K5V6_DREPO|nr:hypothetical protein DPMN_106798 [Dreissena polymorpha]